MARLSRAQTQERNRAKVLAAARDEFAERGFRDAKIDDIAERAELTRGAVYSNFPGKRALYFAVLADAAERGVAPASGQPGSTAREALGAFARAWVTRQPIDADLPGEEHGAARIGMDLMPEIQADQRIRQPFLQLTRLRALLLAVAVERLSRVGAPRNALQPRSVRLAEIVLTVLHGAGTLAAAAPGFGEPFDVISACERLAGLELNDWWSPPTASPPVRATDEPWPHQEVRDLLRGTRVGFAGDGVLVVVGLHRAGAVEEVLRAVAEDAQLTVALVTGQPHELMPLTRLVIVEVAGCLRQAFPEWALPRLRLVCDESGALAAAAGVPAISDGTEAAVRIASGRIVARADGFGAGYAVAAAPVDSVAL
ncbi:MAG TPA: helix-turn-helix domain-containing protein [Pseudonocardiaceae bacterium]|jgi:AcrR family transcriptional regulator|nr:helix-turn-helix domain-containing protein [Pseudonocardiaceae bacterium]